MKKVIGVIFIILIIICSCIVGCLAFDKPEIDFIKGTYEDIVVEYGDKIPVNNIIAIYKGNIFNKDGIDVPVIIEDVKNVGVGEYTVQFMAKYRGIKKRGSYKLKVIDTRPPDLIVNEDTLEYTCVDNVDGDIKEKVRKVEEKDRIIFSVSDSSDNYIEFVVYRDNEPPIITLGNGLIDFYCIDNCDGDITDSVRYYESGGYMYYTAVDKMGNRAEVSKKIENGNKVIYLTFDDGPSSYTSDLLDILKKYEVRATFFVVGTSRYLDILPRMEEEGHTVAAHTYSHEYSNCYSSVDAYFEDLEKVESKIEEQIGHRTQLIRFPGGSSNTVSRKYCQGVMTEIAKAVEEKGYVYFDWNVSSGDAGETTDTNVVIRNVERGIEGCNVAVVLQHDVKKYSVAGVEEILNWGIEKGYVFLPLTEKSFTAHHSIGN